MTAEIDADDPSESPQTGFRAMAAEPLHARSQRIAPASSWAPIGLTLLGALALAIVLIERAALPVAAISAGAALLSAVLSLGVWLRERRTMAPRIAAPSAAAVAAALAADHFPAMLDALDVPLLLVAGERAEDLASQRLVYANAAARELFRTSREAGPLVTAVRDPKVLEAVDQALFANATAETVYEAGGAHDRTWRARATPIADVEGRRLAMLTLSDETELRRSERTRADFLANASHELRTPLASLAGFIETLRGHARDDPAARDRFLAIMQDQAARMARLVEDLMSLSRIELNEHVPPSGSTDLTATVRDVVDALGPMADERRVRLELCAGAEPALARPADRDQLLQVIQNLAENAIKYAPNGSPVRVEVRSGVSAFEAAAAIRPGWAHLSLLTPDHASDRRYVLMRVVDEGPGIAREHLPRLTERFYRVGGQRGDRPGTGLGLAIVKHIVNRHRGGLCVESGAGEGAAFTVYLPSA